VMPVAVSVAVKDRADRYPANICHTRIDMVRFG
jgi:hypothetical protein